MSEEVYARIYARVLRSWIGARPRCAIAFGSWVVERDGSRVYQSVALTRPMVHA